MIASALKKAINTQSTSRRRVSVEQQKAQNSDRFLRGRQISYMIYEHFRAIGADDTAQGLADLVSMTLQNDDVQDFDVRRDHAPLSVSEMPSDPILEGLYKSKLQDSVQLHVNRTPTQTACTEMITFHHANTRGSRLHIFCVSKELSSTCHVSFLAAPDTDHKHKFSLTYLTYLSLTPKSSGSRSTFTLRRFTAEWRIYTNPISYTSDCDGVVRSRNGAKQGAELSQIEDSCKASC